MVPHMGINLKWFGSANLNCWMETKCGTYWWTFMPCPLERGTTKQWLLFNAHSRQELDLLIFDEMMMRSGLLSWICVVLAHWNNSLQINMSAHSDTLSWFWASLCSFSLMLCNKYQFYSLWFERIGLKPTIYHTRGTPKKKNR